MKRKPKSLKKKIIFRMFLITFFVFALTEIFLLDQSRRALNQSLDKALLARLEGLVSLTDLNTRGEIKFDFSDELMPDYSGSEPRAYFLLRRLIDNSEIEHSHSLDGDKLVLSKPLPMISPHKPIFWDGYLKGKTIRFVALRELARPEDEEDEDNNGSFLMERRSRASITAGRVIPPLPHEYLIVVGIDTVDADRQFAGIVRRTSMSLGVGLIILLLSGGIILFFSLKPLSVLEEEVQGISPSNLVPVTVPEIREIAGVARTLNDALRRLKEAFEREKRFTADVAHELRTPISEIRSLAEVALKLDKKMDEHNRHNYQDFLASAQQMQKIVVTLLALARYDAGVLAGQKERFELAPFIISIWKQYRKKAAARNISCRFDISSDISIVTDKNLLRAILENLFSNAVYYTPEGGIIEWEAGLREDEIFVAISNSVVGLTGDDLPHLFERFWRKDVARTPGDAHSGLGLSAARSFASVIDLTITAHLTRPDLLSITLQGDQTGLPEDVTRSKL